MEQVAGSFVAHGDANIIERDDGSSVPGRTSWWRRSVIFGNGLVLVLEFVFRVSHWIRRMWTLRRRLNKLPWPAAKSSKTVFV